MKRFGQEVIVTFNRYATDTDEEIALVAEHCKELGVGFAMNSVFAEGGDGGVELAKLVVDTIENKPSGPLKLVYEDTDTVRDKIQFTEPLLSPIRHWLIKRSSRSKAWVSLIIRSVSPRRNIHSLPTRKHTALRKTSN